MRAIPLLSLLLSGWFVVPAHADEAQDWLNRLGQANSSKAFKAPSFTSVTVVFLPITSGIVSRTVRFVSAWFSWTVRHRKWCALMGILNVSVAL